MTGRDGRKYLRMRQRDRRTVTIRSGQHEADHFSRLNGYSTPAQYADTDFRPLEVQKDADLPPDLLFQCADRGMNASVIVVRTMTEVQADSVDARANQSS